MFTTSLLKKNVYLSVVILISVFISCQKSKDYSDVPYLEFRSFSKQEMLQGVNQQDSVILTLFFTDGDGDFGSESTSTTTNIFFKDLRTGNEFRQFRAPFIPLEGVGNGISGLIKIKIYSTCCIYPPELGVFPCETSNLVPTNLLPLEVYIEDRAGNKSNTLSLDALTLLCQ
jgi:hypothetical protein